MAIDKLTGHPYSDVPSWCFEKEKYSKKDPGLPMRPSNKRTDIESELPAPKIAKVLDNLVKKVNVIIEEIAKIPPLEIKLDIEIDDRIALDIIVNTEISDRITLESRVDTEIMTRETEVAALKADVTALESKIQTVEADLTSLTNQLTSHSSIITPTPGGHMQKKGGPVRTLSTGGDIEEKQSIIARILKKLNG